MRLSSLLFALWAAGICLNAPAQAQPYRDGGMPQAPPAEDIFAPTFLMVHGLAKPSTQPPSSAQPPSQLQPRSSNSTQTWPNRWPSSETSNFYNSSHSADSWPQAPNAPQQADSGTSRANTDRQTGEAAERTPIGEAPEDVSEIFLRQTAVLLKPGESQWDVGLAYTWQENRFPTVLSTSELAMQHSRYRLLELPISARFGLNECTEVFGQSSLGLAMLEQANPEVDDWSTRGGLGDLTLGVKRQLARETAKTPDVVFSLFGTAPTGSSPFLGQPATGGGVWVAGANLTLIKSFDPVIVFGGVGYSHPFARRVGGRFLQPGEMFSYSMGMGLAINDDILVSSELQGSFQTYTYYAGERIPDSLSEPISMRFAMTRILSRDRYVEPYVNFGLTSDAPDVELGINWTWTRRPKKREDLCPPPTNGANTGAKQNGGSEEKPAS